MSINGDYITAQFNNEFDNLDHSEFPTPLRKIETSFSEANDFKKDIQFIVDENLINHIFLGLFYKKNVISLTEEAFRWMPTSFKPL